MRVLVVEDEPDLRKVLCQVLRENDYAVDEASDGEEGLYKAQAWDYDALVLDLMLPKITGWELLRRMRSKKKTPVLILTARDTVNDRIRGLDEGADDYLVKPFEMGELLARLRALIRRAAGTPVATIEIGDVVVDTRTRKVTRAGHDAGLTAREYTLVELLALRRGELVTKTMIYEHIFDENDDSLSNLIEVHVANIRKKLGRDFIKTRRGLGYVVGDN